MVAGGGCGVGGFGSYCLMDTNEKQSKTGW